MQASNPKVGDRIKFGSAEGTIRGNTGSDWVVEFDEHKTASGVSINNYFKKKFLEDHAEVIVPPLKLGDKVRSETVIGEILCIRNDTFFIEWKNDNGKIVVVNTWMRDKVERLLRVRDS